MSLKSDLNFIKTVLGNYKVGTFMPSSKYVIKKIIKEIKPHHKFIVEYGAGNGAITKEILKILPPNGKLIAVELDNNFINELKKIKDQRLTIIQEDAFKISERLKTLLPTIDVVVSSLPFMIIKQNKIKEIIENTHNALSKQGVFIICQHFPIVFLYLKKFFKNNIKWNFEPRNSIPYFIITAKKD